MVFRLAVPSPMIRTAVFMEYPCFISSIASLVSSSSHIFSIRCHGGPGRTEGNFQIMIREIYYGLLLGDYNATQYVSMTDGHRVNGHEHEHDKSDWWFKIEHTKHCFDYLQQSIRCAGLMQIELPHGPDRNVFDGYGSPHTCKRWVSVYHHSTNQTCFSLIVSANRRHQDNIMRFMEDHRVTDE